MAHREELLAATLAVWGSAQLRGRAAVPWAELETELRADLTASSEHRSHVRFLDAPGGDRETPVDWLAALGRDGASRVVLLPLPRDGEGPASARVGGFPVDRHLLHAFAGTGGVLLAASIGDRLRRFAPKAWLPPATTLRAEDVLDHVARHARSDDLRRALLWQDEHNLRVTDGTDWDAFVAALRPEHDEALVRAVDMTFGNVRFSREESAGWYELKRARKNPDHFWQVDWVRLADAALPVPQGDVAAQAARLRAALSEIESFALGVGEAGWAAAFRRARQLLDGEGTADPGPARSLASAGLPAACSRLLEAALAADVFGGMGSWNDLVPEDREGHRRVSAALFGELLPSLVTAVNASPG